MGVEVSAISQDMYKIVSRDARGEDIHYLWRVYDGVYIVVTYVRYIVSQNRVIETGHSAKFFKEKHLKKWLKDLGVAERVGLEN